MNHPSVIVFAPPPASFDALQRTCAACGETHPIPDVTPIARDADGTPTAHVCRACATPRRPAN